eukprot:4316015-Pyramimonas_sp.AAC.1
MRDRSLCAYLFVCPRASSLTGGSGMRSQAARSSRRVAEACVRHASRGSVERQRDPHIERQEIRSES